MGALVHGDRCEERVASRLTRPEFHEQRLELATRGDGLHEVADLAFDCLKRCSGLL